MRFKRSLLVCVTSHDIPTNDSQLPCRLAKLTPKELMCKFEVWLMEMILDLSLADTSCLVGIILRPNSFIILMHHAKPNKLKIYIKMSTFKRLAVSPLHKPVTPFIFTV